MPSTKLTRPLAKKRATFIIAAGAAYGPGSVDADKNYLVPWLRTLFGFLGLEEMQFVLADSTRELGHGKIRFVNLIWPPCDTSIWAPLVNQVPHPGRSEALRRP